MTFTPKTWLDNTVLTAAAMVDVENRLSAYTDTAIAGMIADRQVFTVNGTWTKPAGARIVRVIVVGAGGGGGSGCRRAAGTARTGGNPGNMSPGVELQYSAIDLSSTVSITVGVAGTGGAAVTVDDTNGNAGTAGGSSLFGSLVSKAGGHGGAGGNITGGTGTSQMPLFGGSASQGSAAAINAAFAAGAGGANTLGIFPVIPWVGAGGGPGGGITSANVESAGSGGTYNVTAGGAGTTGGVTPGGNAVASASVKTLADVLWASLPAYGGGGGAGGNTGGGSATAAAGYGSGGGGGGASLNGFNSGAGAAGSGGLVIVISYG